jgi:hypothetical protein
MPRFLPFGGRKAANPVAGRVSSILTWAALTGLVVLAVVGESRAQVVSAPPAALTTQQRIIPGEVIVRFQPGISDEARNQSLAAVGAVYAGTQGLPEGGEVVLARVPVGTEVACAEKLAIDTNVLAAQPNTPARLEVARQ